MTFLAINLLIWILPALLLVVIAVLWRVHRRRTALRHLIGSSGPSALVSNASAFRRRILQISMFSTIVLVAIALLRPIGGMMLTEHRLPAKNIILLVDVSKSMGVADADGLTRLASAKLFARELIDRRASDRIGLVSFAGAAYSECPTTLDRTMLYQRIDVQEPGGLPAGGTDLSAALEQADSLLTETPPPGSCLVILSDGDNMTGDPVEDAARLGERGIPIFTVAFGDPKVSSPVPGSKASSQPDYVMLQQIADATDATSLEGQASLLDSNLNLLSNQIDAIEINGSTISSEIFSRPLELYAYPLSIAVGLLFLRLFLPARTRRWHPLTSMVALFALVIPASATAQDASQLLAEAFVEAEKNDRHVVVIFTGSDWSETSITFETEILSHPVYQTWKSQNVVEVLIDLPRANLDAEVRRERRELASRYAINTFPTALFLDVDDNELGRLTHDTNGPASWTQRADAILAGRREESDSVASIERLPEGVQEMLNDPEITAAERSIRHYNHAIELEKRERDLALTSKDRFQLLEELHTTAAVEAPEDLPHLAFSPTYKIALLHHQKGRLLTPQKPKDALKLFATASQYYEDASGLDPAHQELPGNFALLFQDREKAQQIIDFQQAYQVAVETTLLAYQQEDRFRRSLDQGVTTLAPLNDSSIDRSTAAIIDLIAKATAVEFPETQNFQDALEDIELAPAPHGSRHLHPSSTHIKDALDHLLQVAQPQPQSGEGEGEGEGENSEGDQPDGNGDGDGDEGGDEDSFSNSESDLKEAEGQGGSLRDRMLEKLGRDAKPVPPSRDR